MADENDPAVANRPRTRVVNEPVKALATPAAVKPERDPQQADVASVRVLLRVRPTSVSDLRLGYTSHAIECADERVLVPVGGGMRTFNFDRVLPPSAGQQQLFDSMTDMVDGFLEGYNSTLFAYGQTGSGKTYTMGTSTDSLHAQDSAGVLPRFLDVVLEHARANCIEWSMAVSFVELHNEELRDLLNDHTAEGRARPITLRESARGGVIVQGLKEEAFTTREEALATLARGCAIRATGATNMNVHSSRSHALAVFTLHQLLGSADGTESERRRVSSKFSFVDLAGSERVKRTQAEGNRFKEGVSINQGLLALGKVISALADKEKGLGAGHVPYRDSKLTRLLRDSLGGNSRTAMIACVSPADCDLEETLSTLRYAARAAQIKNRPVQNVTQDDASTQIAALQAQVAVLQQQLARQSMGGMGALSPFTPAHLAYASSMHTPAPRSATDDTIPPLGDLDGLEDGSGTDDELAWMSMLVESSAAALNESLLEEEEGGGDEPGAGGVLHLEASRLDASIRTREAALQQLVRTRRALHDACTRENQMTQRIKLLEAEISSVDSERKRMEAQLRTTTTMSEKEQRELHSKYAEKVNTLKEQLAGMRTQQLAAARLKTLHQQASTRLEAMQAEILRQKQQRVMMQRQLREQQKEKRREHAEHLKEMSKLQRTAAHDSRELSKLKHTLQVREAAVQRKQEEIARLKSIRTREVTAVGELAGDGLSKGAEWLHECILECAAEGNAQAMAETAIDRRAGALAALSEHTGSKVRGSGIGSRFDMSKTGGKRDAASEARCAELEAEAAYAAALVEEAQANVARYSGGMERLCSRIGTLRLMPARSLACALAVEARDAQMEVLRLTEQNAVLHASLNAKHTAHGSPVAQAESAQAAQGEGAEFFHAVSMMQLEYEQRIAVLVDEISKLQTSSLGGSEAAGGAVASALLPVSDSSTRDRVLEMKEDQVARLQCQLAAAQHQLVTAEQRVTMLECREAATDDGDLEEDDVSQLPDAVSMRRGNRRGARGADAAAVVASPVVGLESPATPAVSTTSHTKPMTPFNPCAADQVLHLVGPPSPAATRGAIAVADVDWEGGGVSLSDRQEAAFQELTKLAEEVGLTDQELQGALAAAEARVAAAWALALTDARARRDALLLQEARLEQACAAAAHALGGTSPTFDEPSAQNLSVRARLTRKAELLNQLELDAAAQHALLTELNASIRQQAAVLGGGDQQGYLDLWHASAASGAPGEPTLLQAITAAKSTLQIAEAQVAARATEVEEATTVISALLHALEFKPTAPMAWVPKQHAPTVKMVCEGRMDELGLSDDVWTQLQQLRDIVQRAANDRVDKMARATYQLEEITACLNGASIPPLPQDGDTAVHATADDVPTEAAIAEVLAALQVAVGQLEGKCREVIKALVSLWQEMGVPLSEQEAKEEAFNALDRHHRLRAVNAEHEKQAERAAKLRPLLAMVREREELRLKMVEFEQSASDKSRLYARGTQLLEEERFRKHVAINYPKIISKLNKAIAAWEQAEQTDFYYQGVDYKTTLTTEDPLEKMELLHLRVAKVGGDADASSDKPTAPVAKPAPKGRPESARTAAAKTAAAGPKATRPLSAAPIGAAARISSRTTARAPSARK